MEFIDYKKVSEWTKQNNLGGFDKDYRKHFVKILNLKHSFPIPGDSGQKTHIASYLLSGLKFDEGMLYLSGFNVWNLGDSQELINAYLNFLGDERKFNDAPCFKFNESDMGQIKCLLSIILYLLYDATVILKCGGKFFIVDISHDEFMDIYSNDEVEMKNIIEYMNSKKDKNPH